MELDVEGRKLSLGHKQTKENPWDKYEKQFGLNSVHQAEISEIVDKGAIINECWRFHDKNGKDIAYESRSWKGEQVCITWLENRHRQYTSGEISALSQALHVPDDMIALLDKLIETPLGEIPEKLTGLDLSTLNVAYSEDLGIAPVDNEIRKIFQSRVKTFSHVFATATETSPDLTNAHDIFEIQRGVNFVTQHADRLEN